MIRTFARRAARAVPASLHKPAPAWNVRQFQNAVGSRGLPGVQTQTFLLIKKNSFSTFSISSGNDKVSISTEGQEETLDWRMFYECGSTNNKLSPWHDIPLHYKQEEDLFNYVNEIPRGTRAKNEISTTEEHTPIKQDTKKGKLRYFKYGDIPFNYGCLPQTWEDPNAVSKDTNLPGDNDPIDVCELSDGPISVGAVEPVKLLGLLGLIDEGETDWKILAISKNHQLAGKLNDIGDVEQHIPGKVDEIRDWFKNYKVPDGKPQNSFSHNEEAQPKSYANEIVEETHGHWKDLVEGKIDSGDLHVNKAKA